MKCKAKDCQVGAFNDCQDCVNEMHTDLTIHRDVLASEREDMKTIMTGAWLPDNPHPSVRMGRYPFEHVAWNECLSAVRQALRRVGS